tara:strand:- start:891 stop:2093 length:1203 start_codon:yes stop_codon:yes gene_type:complete
MPENDPGYGSSDWEPSDLDELTSLSSEDIASGFGLDSTYAKYFDPYDSWKADFARDDHANTQDTLETQNTLDLANLGIKQDSLDSAGGYAGDDLKAGLEQDILAVSSAYSESMTQMIDSQASGLIGGASIRNKKTMGSNIQDASDTAGKGKNTNYGRVLDDLSTKQDSLDALSAFTQSDYLNKQAANDTSRDYADRADKEKYKDELDLVMGDLANEGTFDQENKSQQEWLTSITSQDDHWQTGDFKDRDGKYYTNEFLEWFSENQGSVDRAKLKTSKWEVENAHTDWKNGKNAGDSSAGTWCCTAAMDTGYMTTYKTTKLKVWHLSKSSIWREGYDVWGEVIAKTFISKYKWAGECTEAFYQWKVNNNKTKKGLVAICFIVPISYLIGFLKVSLRSFYAD